MFIFNLSINFNFLYDNISEISKKERGSKIYKY